MWPWAKREPERRQSGGGYTDAVVSAIEAQASATVADVSSTAAIEAAAGALSRALVSAEVEGPGWARDAVSPPWLAQVGRSLVREGASLSVVTMAGDGVVELVPAAFWNFENLNPGAQEGERESSWQARCTTYGPSTSFTRIVDRDGMIFVRWGTSPGTRYRGQGPTSWAHLTARLQGEAERSLADEASGPLAQIITANEGEDLSDTEDGTDTHAEEKAMLKAARGRLALVETVKGGGENGPAAAPATDWNPRRLGPDPPTAFVEVANSAFTRMLAACGVPPAMFTGDADGTAQREGLRRWHMNVVLPIARLLEDELRRRLEVDIKLRFDVYAMDIAGRAGAFRQFVSQGMDIERALALTGLLTTEE